MATPGQSLIHEASKYLGQREGAANRSGGAIVDACQRHFGLTGVPWCGCFVGFVASRVGFEPFRQIGHPAVAVTHARATERGWVKAGGATTPPGSLFLIAGKHIGFVLESSSRYFRTVEGNAGNACASLTRAWSDGWQAVVAPGLGTSSPAERQAFGFEDITNTPKRFGPWADKAGRDRVMADYAAANPNRYTRAIRVPVSDGPAFAFESGPKPAPAVYRFGPWADKAGRDRVMAAWERSTGRKARPFRTLVPVADSLTPTVGGIGEVN